MRHLATIVTPSVIVLGVILSAMPLIALAATEEIKVQIDDVRQPSAARHEDQLSEQERRWLSQHPEIRIGITVIPPQILQDRGGYKGLSIDYIRLLEKKLGYHFRLVPYATWNEVIKAAKDRQIDMIFAAQMTPERSTYLQFSKVYIELPNMILVRKDRPGGGSLRDLKGWHVAVSEGSAVHEYLEAGFPDLILVPVQDELSGLMEVSLGEADAMVVEISRASYYIDKAGILNLRVSGDAEFLYQLRFAVRNDWPILTGILDKGLASITNAERKTISRRWILVGEPGVFSNTLFWVMLGVALLSIFAVAVWNLSLQRLVNRRTRQLRLELAERERAEMKFHAIFDQSFQFIGLLSTDGTLLEVNRAALEFSGVDEEAVLGKPFWDTLWWGHSAEQQQSLRDAILEAATGEFVRFEVTNQDREGNIHYIDFSLKPITDSSGQVVQLIPEGRDITERKQMEQMLQLREWEFRTLVEHSPDLIVRYNTDLSRIYVNPAWERSSGLSAAEVLNVPIDQIPKVPNPVVTEYMLALREALETGARQSVEFSWVNARNEKLYLQYVVLPEFDQDGRVTSLLSVGRDITALKHAEKEHKLHAEFLTSLDRINLAIQGAGDLETMLRDVVDEVLDIYDCDRAYLVYPCDPDASTWSVPIESSRPEYPGAGQQGQQQMNEAVAWVMQTLLDSDHARRLGLGSGLPVPEHLQNQFGIRSNMAMALRPKVEKPWQFGIHQCSHDRIWSDQEVRLFEEIGHRLADGLSSMLIRRDLRESEAKYRRIVDTAREGILTLDASGRVTFMNAHIAVLLGYTLDELMGHQITDFMLQEDLADHQQKMDNRKNNRAETYERRLLKKDGTLIWVLISAAPIFEGDRYRGALTMVTDITGQKLKEDELRRYRDSLEEKVQQRTEELRLARDASEAANKAKSVFLANMSHELRTPLNAILGFSNMMQQDSGLNDNQRETLNIINRSGEHLLKLINDVLEIAKIEAGKVQLQIATFDLHAMVREVIDMMRLRAQQKGLQLELDQSSEFPRYIKGDEARLRQILVNLVSNAVKFTEQGGATIRLTVKDNTKHHLLIEVEDTGPGIGEDDRQCLFRPFVQLSSGTAQTGTGLGLSIVRQFVLLMDGNVSVESTPGKGSLFRVELPLDEAEEVEVIRLGQEIRGEVIGLAPGQSSYRILIAEDQRDNQLLLVRLMTDIGMEVRTANDGKECIRIFKEWRPDLIWMDRRMPVMDGVEAMQRIRKLPGGKKVKIVAVTASAFKEQQSELLEAGMDAFVRKPYRFNEIYNSLAIQLGVKFIYRADATAKEIMRELLSPQRMRAVPAELRNDLRAALECLDRERIDAVVGRIGHDDAELGDILVRLADEFDYPDILRALDAVNGQ